MSEEIRKQILEWCAEEGIGVKERPDEAKKENSAFLFELSLKGKIPTTIYVFFPQQFKDKVVLNSGVTVASEIQEKMKGSEKFLDELSFTLTGRPTMFALNRTNGAVDYINLSTSLYVDGFSKNAFMGAVNDIHKSRVLTLWMLHKRL
jgi:hypothetical protein